MAASSPIAGTFLVFADYMRPAIRLAALMRQRVIHVLTHDSIGLGEDGPTHQPVEHLAGLRAHAHLVVFRPADAMETAECWELAVRRADGPEPAGAVAPGRCRRCRTDAGENRCARGGYVLAEADGAAPGHADRHGLARSPSPSRRARAAGRAEGIPAAVVSLPCWELFAARTTATALRCWAPCCASASRPRCGFGWERWLGAGRHLHRHDRLRRLSAPAEDLFRHFGITPEAIARRCGSGWQPIANRRGKTDIWP